MSVSWWQITHLLGFPSAINWLESMGIFGKKKRFTLNSKATAKIKSNIQSAQYFNHSETDKKLFRVNFLWAENEWFHSPDELSRSPDELSHSPDKLFLSLDELCRSPDELFRSPDELFRSLICFIMAQAEDTAISIFYLPREHEFSRI